MEGKWVGSFSRQLFLFQIQRKWRIYVPLVSLRLRCTKEKKVERLKLTRRRKMTQRTFQEDLSLVFVKISQSKFFRSRMNGRLGFIQPSFNLFNLLIDKLLREKRELSVGAVRHESLLDNATNTWTYIGCTKATLGSAEASYSFFPRSLVELTSLHEASPNSQPIQRLRGQI